MLGCDLTVVQIAREGLCRAQRLTGLAREFIAGVVEMLSGVLCMWLAPIPYKPLGPWLVYSGFDRAFDAVITCGIFEVVYRATAHLKARAYVNEVVKEVKLLREKRGIV